MDSSSFSLTWISGLNGGRKVTVTAGTPVRIISTKLPCSGVLFQALRSNTGIVAVGGSDVSVVAGAETSPSLVPGQTILLPVNNLNFVYLDSSVNGEGVTYLILKG